MIEGGPSRNYHNTKAFMYAEPKAWFALMDKLADMVITYLKAQINAGAKSSSNFRFLGWNSKCSGLSRIY